MLLYFWTRQHLRAYLLFMLYVTFILLYLEIIPSDYLYRCCIFPFLAAAITLWPYLFAQATIKNPTTFQEDAYNFSLLGKEGQYLPVSHPQTGILIAGTPGCGKTKCLIEPILFKMIQKGYAGIVYDYDFAASPAGPAYSLTHLAYHCYRHFTHKHCRFFSVNLQDLHTTSRINPIAPDYIQDRKKLSHGLHTFLLNLNPQIGQKEDFWYKNTYALLKGVIVLLANRYPQYCTLPHAILLGLQPHKRLMAALQTDPEASLYASPVLDAFKQAPEQFAGVIANFKVSLERLLDQHVFWVLSGHDVPTTINDKENPVILCLGNTPKEKEVISPILSMIIAVLIGNMYGHASNKSFLMIDELPTLFLPHLSEIPATARKYNIATVVALQNMAQLERTYTPIGAKEIQETFSNHFIGRGQLRLSKALSDMLGKKEIAKSSKTTHAQDQTSETVHQQEALVITPQEAMTLQTGEFIGKVVHQSGGFFKMALEPIKAYHKKLSYKHFQPLPTIHQQVDVAANFARIQEEVEEIAKQCMPWAILMT